MAEQQFQPLRSSRLLQPLRSTIDPACFDSSNRSNGDEGCVGILIAGIITASTSIITQPGAPVFAALGSILALPISAPGQPNWHKFGSRESILESIHLGLTFDHNPVAFLDRQRASAERAGLTKHTKPAVRGNQKVTIGDHAGGVPVLTVLRKQEILVAHEITDEERVSKPTAHVVHKKYSDPKGKMPRFGIIIPSRPHER
ncbi:hypothetical protein DBV05_g8393 [Lasiodiplodia theobromae]|uniref:Uncharacterized protein n=1 Tax=Lasiodiplodia theobromae TaxID=45133 RepID=A0A5N5D5B6_9PEZI|nr:hypothetical protein DBV05_g8393 [Lasiodiplodia theobromae]